MNGGKLLKIGDIVDCRGRLLLVKDFDYKHEAVLFEPVIFGNEYQEYPPNLISLPYESVSTKYYQVVDLNNVFNQRSWDHFLKTGQYLPQQMMNGVIYCEKDGKWEYLQNA